MLGSKCGAVNAASKCCSVTVGHFMLGISCWAFHAGHFMLGISCWAFHAGHFMQGWAVNVVKVILAKPCWALHSEVTVSCKIMLSISYSTLHTGQYMLSCIC
jgi:hypothetical protein